MATRANDLGAAFFYHLTQSTLEQTLPTLLAKSRAAGWVIEVRGTDAAAMERLDVALWQSPPDGFLPHGLAGGAHDADQTILLTVGQPAVNGPTALLSVHGADVTAAEVQGMARVSILFDGHDGAALDKARSQWKALTDAGCAAQYWAQEDGRWTKKAEKDPAAS